MKEYLVTTKLGFISGALLYAWYTVLPAVGSTVGPRNTISTPLDSKCLWKFQFGNATCSTFNSQWPSDTLGTWCWFIDLKRNFHYAARFRLKTLAFQKRRTSNALVDANQINGLKITAKISSQSPSRHFYFHLSALCNLGYH